MAAIFRGARVKRGRFQVVPIEREQNDERHVVYDVEYSRSFNKSRGVVPVVVAFKLVGDNVHHRPNNSFFGKYSRVDEKKNYTCYHDSVQKQESG